MKFSHAFIALVAGMTNALPQGQEQWSAWQHSSQLPAPTPVDNSQKNGQPLGQQSPTPLNSPPASGAAGQGQWSEWQSSSTSPVNSPPPTITAAVQPSPTPDVRAGSPLPASSPAPTVSLAPASQQGQWSVWGQQSAAPVASPAVNKNNVPRGFNGQATWQAIGQGNGQPDSSTPASTTNSPAPSPNVAFQAPAASASAVLGSPPSTTCSWEFILTCAGQAADTGSTCMGPMAESSTNCFSQPACAAAIGDNAPTCASCFTSTGKEQFVNALYQEKATDEIAPVFEAFVNYGVCNSQGVEIHN